MVKCRLPFLPSAELLVLRFLGKLGEFGGELDDIFLVDIANHRDQQAAVGIYGHANIDVLLVDDFIFCQVDAGVELREDFQAPRRRLSARWR